MEFADFWSKLTKATATKATFHTLVQKKNFDAVYSNNIVIITPKKTQAERNIHVSEFKKVWAKATMLPDHEKYKPANYQKISFDASYILAMMKAITTN